MLNKQFNFADVPEPSSSDFIWMAAQHITVTLLLVLLIHFLQCDYRWRKNSYVQVIYFYMIQVMTYATLPWFTKAENTQSFATQCFCLVLLQLAHNLCYPVP